MHSHAGAMGTRELEQNRVQSEQLLIMLSSYEISRLSG